jgi:Fe2+ or Zn2+ uptake regulation protein
MHDGDGSLMCGHCKAEDAVVCEECGVLVAFEYQPEHRAFHEKIAASASRLVPVEGLDDEERA